MANNIRKLHPYMTVIDDERSKPGSSKLKLIRKLMSKEPVNDPNVKV